MRQTAPRQKENEHGRLTLVDLLSAVALFMPMAAMVGEVKVAGGGVLRYLFGLPLTLLLDPLGDPKVHKMVKFQAVFELGAHHPVHSLNGALRIKLSRSNRLYASCIWLIYQPSRFEGPKVSGTDVGCSRS